MNRDMGPATRCLGKQVPAVHTQLVSFEIKSPSGAKPDYSKVKADIAKVLTEQTSVATPDTVDGKPWYGAMLSNLAWQCAATFRATDKAGGCNGEQDVLLRVFVCAECESKQRTQFM